MRALVLTTSATTNLQDVVSSVDAHGLTPDQITLATHSAALPAGALGAGYDLILSVAAEPGHHTVPRLGALAAALRPGGLLVVKQTAESSEEDLRKSLLLSGFTGVEVQPDGQGLALQARKPEWETGARAAISLRKPAAAAQPAQPAAAAAWVVSPNDEDGGEEEEMVDEDDLLTEEDKARPAPAANDDCEVGAAGRKACKNCTCGRAEEGPDAKPAKLTKEMLDNPTSGCGSCALGDAFRCGGCPYRGLPAFEMGKPIQLPADFLAVDL